MGVPPLQYGKMRVQLQEHFASILTESLGYSIVNAAAENSPRQKNCFAAGLTRDVRRNWSSQTWAVIVGSSRVKYATKTSLDKPWNHVSSL